MPRSESTIWKEIRQHFKLIFYKTIIRKPLSLASVARLNVNLDGWTFAPNKGFININLLLENGEHINLGLALMEEYLSGHNNLHDYLLPTIGDVPPIESIIVEVADALGPYGAKGLGEHVMVPTAPAILGAIHHATGVWVQQLPASPERISAAISSQKESFKHG